MSNHVGAKHKRWVLLQNLDKVPGEFDTVPAEWVTQHTVRCSIEPKRSREVIEGTKVNEQVTHLIRLRWMPNVSSKWRIVLEDTSKATDDEKRIFNIDEVVNWKDRNKYLDCFCIERK